VKLLETSENVKAQYQEQCRKVSPTVLLNAFNLSSESEQRLRYASQPRLVVELALLKLAYLESAVAVASGEAEKKKPLSQAPEVVTPVAEPIATPPVSREPVVVAPVPVAEERTVERVTASGEQMPARKESGRLRSRTPEFSLKNSIQEIGAAEMLKTASLVPEVEEDIRFGVNPHVQIDETQFKAALGKFAENARQNNKMNLVSAFQHPIYELNHNQWTLKVENEIIKSVVERERDALLPFLRNTLNVPDLFMELEIDTQFKHPDAVMPYTEEEKLAVMTKRNPSLKKLQEIFKTRIIYQ
jgi:DNA polymerase III subunit gamma/tau